MEISIFNKSCCHFWGQRLQKKDILDDSNIHHNVHKDFQTNSIKEYLYSNPNNEGSSHRCDEDELDNSNNDVSVFGYCNPKFKN